MASVEDLTNNEIRTKLAEFGAPVGPVTETTRKVLLKKLKHLMVQRELSGVEANSSKARKSFSRFSSGEEDSDDDVKTKSENMKMPPPSSSYRSTRRQTVGSPRVNDTTASVGKSRRSIQAQSTSKPLAEETEKTGRIGRYSSLVSVSTNRPSPISNNVTTRRGSQRPTVTNADEYDEGSDSDTVSKVSTSRFRETKTVSVEKGEPNSVSSPSVLSRLSGFQSSYLSDHNGETSSPDISSTAVGDLLSFRKRYSISTDAPSASPDTSYPYTSNFARRLTLARGRKPGTSLGDTSPHTLELLKIRDPDLIKDDGVTPSTFFASSRENGHFFSSQLDSSMPYTSKRSHDIADEFKTTEDDVAFWKNSQTVSMILLAVAFVFFLGLGVVYMNVRSKDTSTFFAENERNVFPICSSTGNGGTSVQPCIKGSDLDAATELLKILHPRLVEQAVAAECGPPLRDGSYVSPIMSESDALKFLSEQTTSNLTELKKNLHDLKLMLMKNPHWGVSVTSPYQPVGGDRQDQVEDVRVLMEHGGMRVNSPVLPLFCWLKKMLVLAVLSALVIGGGFGVLYGIQKTVTWYHQRREQEKQEVYRLVQQIIELLQSHHHSAGSPGGIGTHKSFLAINHVRDQLIAPQDRSRMAGLWEKAVSFLENNESRVRHEVQIIAGEECPVWRWLPSSYANTSLGSHKAQHSPLPESILEPFNPNRNKVWQGQAFETEAGSPNNLPCSPTPCLKLRHMFDVESEYGDDWPVKVQDAILEKCDGVKVLHIAVDKTSNEGCVYVKCTSQEEAGKAYRALHGWWFDSKLVTVKYIRLERYHERFPDAKNAKHPLKPSNNKKLSLQANFWQSPLEAN